MKQQMSPTSAADAVADADALWDAHTAQADPASVARFTSALQLDVAAARCCATRALSLPDPCFDAYVLEVKAGRRLK